MQAIIVNGTTEEIAALALAVQERRSFTDIGINSKIQTGSFSLDKPLEKITFESL